MSEYWKSLPRKYCDSCKCWFADNKASLEFHEKGKRHQENVQKRINEIQKKGLKEYKAKKELENEMLKIEKAALEAFKKDMKNNPDLTAQCITNSIAAAKVMEAEVSKPERAKEIPKKQPKVPKKDISAPKEEVYDKRIWYEGVSDEGHTYYWNSETSESQWEPPEEGYISLQEQNEQYPAVSSQDVEDDSKPEKKEKKSKSKEGEDTIEANPIGPLPKPDPYGQWVTVEKKEVQHVDLELPVLKDDGVEVHISLPKEDRLKIREKTVGQLSSSDYGASESTFKKRKNLGNTKRSIRQRLEDS